MSFHAAPVLVASVAADLEPSSAHRYLADFRLVVATMHMDVIPASYVRGFCTVRHKEHVTDMDAYKRTPDAFYWTQVRLPLNTAPTELIVVARAAL